MPWKKPKLSRHKLLVESIHCRSGVVYVVVYCARSGGLGLPGLSNIPLAKIVLASWPWSPLPSHSVRFASDFLNEVILVILLTAQLSCNGAHVSRVAGRGA